MKIRLLVLAALVFLVGRVIVVNTRPPAGAPTRGGVVTLEMSVWGMPWENALYTDVYIPEFERQNPNIKVKFCHFEDYDNRILLSYAGGISPDVIRQSVEGAIPWIHRGLDLPLDGYIDGPEGIDRKDFIPTLWEGLEHRGKTYGVPQDINILGLFYNKELFDRAGLAYPNENWTWDDLKRASEKLTQDRDHDGHPEVEGLDMAWNAVNYRPFLLQNGGKLWKADQETPSIDTPEAIGALRFYKSLMHSYSLTRSDSQRGGLGPDKFFEQGRLAMYLDGTWRTPAVKKNAPNLRFGVAPLPRGRQAMSVSNSCFWAISSQSRHPAEAWKLVKFLSSKESLIQYWQQLWVAPPARWSALRSPEFRKVTGMPGKIPAIASRAEFDEKCGWIPTVLEKGWTTTNVCGLYIPELMPRLQTAVDKVMLENADPAKELRVAQKETMNDIRQAKIARGEDR